MSNEQLVTAGMLIETLAKMTEEPAPLETTAPCPQCGGLGGKDTCPICQGSGTVMTDRGAAGHHLHSPEWENGPDGQQAGARHIPPRPAPSRDVPTANGRQVGGDHYRKVAGEQHWDRAWRLYGPGPFQYQITKYVERYRDKGWVQDLEKARHFIDKLIELEEAAAAGGQQPGKG